MNRARQYYIDKVVTTESGKAEISVLDGELIVWAVPNNCDSPVFQETPFGLVFNLEALLKITVKEVCEIIDELHHLGLLIKDERINFLAHKCLDYSCIHERDLDEIREHLGNLND